MGVKEPIEIACLLLCNGGKIAYIVDIRSMLLLLPPSTPTPVKKKKRIRSEITVFLNFNDFFF